MEIRFGMKLKKAHSEKRGADVYPQGCQKTPQKLRAHDIRNADEKRFI
jgi:hypothetical protein